MSVRVISDPAEIATFTHAEPWLHLYELGDLDARFFPHTRWWGIGAPLRALCLLYTASDPPTLICLAPERELPAAEALLSELAPELTPPFYAHLTPGLERLLVGSRRFEGRHSKMGLCQPERLRQFDAELADVERLGTEHSGELEALYQKSSAHSWFAAWTLETGFYFGLREGGALVAAAGVHVVCPEQRVAAIGNVATDPAYRGRGLATRVTARLCRALLEVADHVGLNVQADNAAAIACYRKLGFGWIADYHEISVTD
jgi:ribosomal protein S18 acetylase RimI-like enzyme